MSAVIHSLTTAQLVTGAEFCSEHGFELELANGHGWDCPRGRSRPPWAHRGAHRPTG